MPQDPDSFGVATRRDGATAVVELEGELDLHGVGILTAAVGDLLGEPPPRSIAVDAARLTFIDSAGLRALLVAQRDAEAAGAVLGLVNSSPPVDRVLGMTGLHARLELGRPPAPAWQA